MSIHRANRIEWLRRGLTANALAVLLFLSLGARTASDLFHTEGPLTSGVTISAPCNACNVEATAVVAAPAPPALPVLTVSSILIIVPGGAHPFVPLIIQNQGRAPPAL